MGTKERREREREDTREKILQAARELFVARGYENVTMRAIAQEVEYTPTAIYHHFENKQALVTELCLADLGHLTRHLLKAATIVDPIERFRAMGEAYVEFAVDHPNHYRFMFLTEYPIEEGDERIHEAGTSPEEDAYLLVRRTCEEAIQQKRLRPEFTDPDEVAQIFWGELHGLISIQILKKGVPLRDLKATTRRAMEVLFRGAAREKKQS